MIKAPDGGMRMPMVPPAATVPDETESAYPYLRMDGIATFAMVAAVAADEPETAANPPHAATVAMASPPRKWPSHRKEASYRSSDSAARETNTPINMNSGKTENEKLRPRSIICCPAIFMAAVMPFGWTTAIPNRPTIIRVMPSG